MTKTSSTTLTALMCGAVTAQLVAGKATRDALFLMLLGVGALPMMLVATAGVSIVLVIAHARAANYFPPRALVSALLVASGALYFAEWLLGPLAPALTAVIVYLHVTIVGPLLASVFWLVVRLKPDATPDTTFASDRPGLANRSRFGGLAGAGALGGLAGALLTERMAAVADVSFMLVILGVFQLFTSWLTWSLTVDGHESASTGFASTPSTSASPLPASRSGWRVVAEAPHLRALGSLVLLGATSAVLVDCVFKARVVESFGLGDRLLGFFALYHAAVSVLSFLLQSGPSRATLERFGLGLTTGAPSIALLAGSFGSLVAPGLGGLLVAKAAESALRASWFRMGNELFYAPLPAEEKRPARTLIDLGLDRMGDALGGCLVLLATSLAPTPAPVLVALAMTMSIGAVIASSRLNRWRVHTLEGRLVRQLGDINLTASGEETARVVAHVRAQRGADTTLGTSETTLGSGATPTLNSPLLRDIRSLRSGNPERARGVLSRDEGLGPGLVTHVIPLLGVEGLADHADFALRKIVEERVGELTDALLDPSYEVAVRRRLARVFSGCVSQRAAKALLLALGDAPFEVRVEAGRSLAAILNTNPRIRLDRERIIAAVLREIAVARPLWEARPLLDADRDPSALTAFVRDRTQESLALIFTLLSLILPKDPLLFAHRSLQRGDSHTGAAALEYLESVLPPAVRRELLPHLVERREPLRSSESSPAPKMVGAQS